MATTLAEGVSDTIGSSCSRNCPYGPKCKIKDTEHCSIKVNALTDHLTLKDSFEETLGGMHNNSNGGDSFNNIFACVYLV